MSNNPNNQGLDANKSVTFEVLVTYRFNLNNADTSKYKCYATVKDGLDSGLNFDEEVIISGSSDMYIDKKQRLLVTGIFDGMDTYRSPKRMYKISMIRPAKDKAALLAYFSSSRFEGIGKKRASDIIMTLGLSCLEKIQAHPDCLKQVISLNDAMREQVRDRVCNCDMEVEILKLCPNAPAKFLLYMSDAHTKDWQLILHKDPYILLNEIEECPSITFELVDRIGRALNIGLTSENRIRYGVRSVIKYILDKGLPGLAIAGSTFVNLSNQAICRHFMDECVRILNLDWPVIEKNILDGRAGVDLINCIGEQRSDGTCSYICGCYLSEMLKDEKAAGDILHRLSKMPSIVSKATKKQVIDVITDYDQKYCAGASLTMEQRMAIARAMTSRVSVLTGGPGSGKTTVIRGIIYAWSNLSVEGIVDNAMHRGSVSLAAPTGMAVRRMNEAVAAVKPDIKNIAHAQDAGTYVIEDFAWESRTIASYIVGVKRGGVTIDNVKSMRASGVNRLVIIDECSMVSISDFAALLRLVPDAQFVFVGDTEQLPSISAGEVLRNLCEAGNIGVIPITCLTGNHRSKSAKAINDNMLAIRDGDINLINDPGVFDMKYFYHEDELMLDVCVDTYLREVQRTGDIANVSMISPRNVRGVCSVSHLNTIIRERLNPSTINAVSNTSTSYKLVIKSTGNDVIGMSYKDEIDDKIYKLRIGDRVVITKNNCASECVSNKSGGSTDVSVVNGDRGYIREYHVLSPNTRKARYRVFIELDDGRMVTLEDEKLKYVELAYATTVHKAQGCEYDSVIFVAQEGMNFGADFANRNLIYTGITRAKRHCSVIGLQSCMNHCIQTKRPIRHSMLAFRIIGSM